MTTAIRHITTTTGDVRMSPRSEVEDATIDYLRPILAGGGGITAPGIGIRMTGPDAWDIMHGTTVLVRCALDRRARPPELRVSLTIDCAYVDPEIIHMAGDLERCIAWTLLEHPEIQT